MRRIRVIFWKLVYVLMAKWLPVSYTIPFGKAAKGFRGLCAKHILQKCGKNVNVERGAPLHRR